MNFIKRAIISSKRRPGKTVILLLLVFILGNIISGAIAIQQAVQNTELNLRRNLPAVATLMENWDAINQEMNRTGEWVQPGILSPEIIRQVGELPYVNNYDFSIGSHVYSRDLERVWQSENESEDWWSLGLDWLESFSLRGVNNSEILDLQEGIIELVAGRTFTDQEMNSFNQVNSVALVSKDFAELNNLAVGSIIPLESIVSTIPYDDGNAGRRYSDENIFNTEPYEIEIIGIFAPVIPQNSQLDDSQLNEIRNRIYVPNVFAEHVAMFNFEEMRNSLVEQDLLGVWMDENRLFEDSMHYNNIVFVLDDPMYLEDFALAASAVLPDFWAVSDLSSTFSEISTSMETMQWLASIVLWVAVGATLLILSLLITLFLRDRKHEIGIYLALGEKKIKVATQIILEVVSVSFVAITFALFSGGILAGNISETMLKQDLLTQQQEDNVMGGMIVHFSPTSDSLSWFSGGDMTIDEMLESYDLSLDATTMTMFYGIGIGAILISTVVPIAYIMRLDPKKIMM